MAKHIYARVVAQDFTHGRLPSGEPRRIARGSFLKLTASQAKAIESRQVVVDGKPTVAIERATAEQAKDRILYDLTGGAAESEPAKQ